MSVISSVATVHQPGRRRMTSLRKATTCSSSRVDHGRSWGRGNSTLPVISNSTALRPRNLNIRAGRAKARKAGSPGVLLQEPPVRRVAADRLQGLVHPDALEVTVAQLEGPPQALEGRIGLTFH